MADKKEDKKIPVFTVFKKGLIFKNIFLLDRNTSPTLISNHQSIKSVENQNPKAEIEDANDEILLVGRHPDCNILLEHPSISRFHLEIHLQSSLQKLFIIDLSSAHGTWVSDRKVEPQVPVELIEGDTLRLGASTRSYTLHWFPLGRVFDNKNPVISPNFENPLPIEEKEEEGMVENVVLVPFKQNPSPSAPPIPESMNFTLTDDIQEDVLSLSLIRKEEDHSPDIVFGEMSVFSALSAPLGLNSVDFTGNDGEVLHPFSVRNEEDTRSPIVVFNERTVLSSWSEPSVPDSTNFTVTDDAKEVMSPSSVCNEEETYSPVVLFDERSAFSASSTPLGPDSMDFTINGDVKGARHPSSAVCNEEETHSPIVVFEEWSDLSPWSAAPVRPDSTNFTVTDDVEEVPCPSSVCHVEESHSPTVAFDESVLNPWSETVALEESVLIPLSEPLGPDSSVCNEEEPHSPVVVFEEWSELSPWLAPVRPDSTNFTVIDDVEEVLCPSFVCNVEESHSPTVAVDESGFIPWSETVALEESVLIPWSGHLGPDSALQMERASENIIQHYIEESHSPTVAFDESVLIPLSEPLGPDSASSSLSPMERVASENIIQQFDKENQETALTFFAESVPSLEENQGSPSYRLGTRSSTSSLWLRRGKPASLLRIETAKSKGENIEIGKDGEFESQNQNEIEDEPSLEVLFSSSAGEEDVFTPGKENHTPITWLGSKSTNGRRGELELQISYGLLSTCGDEDKDMPVFSRSRLRETDVSMCKRSGSENQNKVEDELTPKVLFSCSDGEDIIFTPGKENHTPNTGLGSKSLREWRGKAELQKSYGSISSCGDEDKGLSTFSDKENLTPVVYKSSSRMKKPLYRSRLRHEADIIVSKRRAGRVPFQSLMENSNSNRKSEVSVPPTRTTNETTLLFSPKQLFRETNRRRWYMVVDTNTLLNKESRRSLQLLQGLKGTQLIVPRMVIRELDYLKKCGSLTRMASEVSEVLQWIEECMVETELWIHVQNSMEEPPIVPTPPASPSWSSWASEGSNGVFGRSVPFFPWIYSEGAPRTPTAGDHILGCALLFKKVKKDGQVVVLSQDIALKIKAMAEGLLCETADEFRENLVSPYSERFMWVGSTPRGPTWSCLDEPALNEYVPAKKKFSKAARGAKKGLKLLLQHNHSRCYVQVR